MAWLSVVLGRMPLQLNFRIFPKPLDDLYGSIMRSVGRYAQVAREIREFLFAPPSGVPEPTLEMVNTSGDCKQCGAIWRRPATSNSALFCAAFVVVNTQGRFASPVFALQGWRERWPRAGYAVLRRLDGEPGEISRLHDGELKVELKPYETHVYVTENCKESVM